MLHIIFPFLQLSLLVHPDKCKHPQAKEAFGGKQIILYFLKCYEYCTNSWNPFVSFKLLAVIIVLKVPSFGGIWCIQISLLLEVIWVYASSWNLLFLLELLKAKWLSVIIVLQVSSFLQDNCFWFLVSQCLHIMIIDKWASKLRSLAIPVDFVVHVYSADYVKKHIQAFAGSLCHFFFLFDKY